MAVLKHARTAALAVTAATATIALTATTAAAEPPEAPPAATAKHELAPRTSAPPHSMTGYSRAKFPHWIEQGNNCNTREVVLKRDGRDVTTDAQCRAVSGTWVSHYDGKTLTSA